jgi:precorrin-8X/cobalt-precorrin-8 methylmutase
MSRAVHPIELQSYEILRSRTDTSGLPPLTRAVLERIVHASADLGYVTDLVCAEDALQAGARALRAGAPLVTDSQMVAAGITSRTVTCRVRAAQAAELAATAGITRSAAGIRVAFAETGPGAVWAIGTALGVDPALVIGVPVGFVGAVETKEALRASGLPAVSNRSERGGAAVAAAAVNALLYAEVEVP